MHLKNYHYEEKKGIKVLLLQQENASHSEPASTSGSSAC